MAKILYGTDPEKEAVYERDGELYALPPYFFRKYLGVQATDDPNHPVFLEGDGWKVHEDGANFEFSIRPSHNPRDLFDTVKQAEKALEDNILKLFPEHCLPNVHSLPTVNWDVDRWQNEGEDFFMSTQFGCDPDEDVWDSEAEGSIMDASKFPFRFCGGHLHLSGSPKIAEDPHLAIRCMAYTAGLAAVAFSDVPRLERDRTFLYGKPGKFRVQNYGVNNPFGPDYAAGIEYRTPSTRWTGVWEIAQKVLSWAEIGVKELLENGLGAELDEKLEKPAIRAILKADQESALELLEYIQERI